MGRQLPPGTVTFLFTDVEGSTKLLHELGAAGYSEALAEHRRVLREAFEAHGGVEVDTQGDAFFVAFPTAPGALAAAALALAGLNGGPILVRMGLHTGTPLLAEEGYVGEDVHRAARIAASGHGGQVLVSASTAPLVSLELTDLGPHRLKDLSAPERIYQLGKGEFPPLKSLYRTNLPIPATAFLGREAELGEVGALLAREDVRLLTLTGPGGTGKTRLALQAAAQASDFYPDGVFWVPLAPLRDRELVMETAAKALGATDGLAEHVTDKTLLLLFDNFEHLVEAAGEVAGLLGGCPNLQVLVTSRERLRVRGEQTWPVPALAESDGAALFSARARAVDPSFTPSWAVAELCDRLDELPLAIELAAARTAVFSPEQLLERLSQLLDLLKGDRDADPRQQTLRATIAWSHDLLSYVEQQLFRRLSVFVGGCTFESAEDVAGADPDTLQSLLDKSLLRKRDSSTGEPRYWMLETIREYATEQLNSSGEADEIGDRHAEHFLTLAEEADPYLQEAELRGALGGLREWLDRLEAEHDNLRTALDKLSAAGETQLVLRMTGALAEFWFENNHFVELRLRLPAALAADERPTAARAKALIGASDTLMLGEDFEGARRRAEEALDIYRRLDDRSGSADALARIASTFSLAHDHLTARPLFEEAEALFRDVDDQDSAMRVTGGLAWGYNDLGDQKRARELYEQNLAHARQRDNKRVEMQSLGGLAMIAADGGQEDEALALARENLPIARNQGRLALATAFTEVAYVLVRVGRIAGAARIVSCSEALREEIGGAEPWVVEHNDLICATTREQLGETVFAEAWEAGQRLSLDEAIALALESLE